MRKLVIFLVTVPVTVGSVWVVHQRNESASRRRIQCKSNLSQIAFLLSDEFPEDWIPRDIVDPESGEPLLSWRVRILKNLHPDLYAGFDLTKPWDSRQNLALVSQMPQLFRCPESSDSASTGTSDYYAVQTEGSGRLSYKSRTVLVVEIPLQTPWTKPEDMSYRSASEAGRLIRKESPRHLHVLLEQARITELTDWDELVVRE